MRPEERPLSAQALCAPVRSVGATAHSSVFESKWCVSNERRWLEIAAHQMEYFNRLADFFDVPQPQAVMDRLRRIVAASGLHRDDVVLDVGTGAGVLLPLIQSYRP